MFRRLMATSDSLGAVVDLAATHHGAFTRRLAAANGVNAHALRSLIDRQLIDEPAPGLLIVRGSAPTFWRAVHAATLLVGERGAIGGTAAGWLHQLDGLGAVPDRVEVVVSRGAAVNPGRLPIDIRASRFGVPAGHVVTVDGMRTTGLARTVCDLATSPIVPLDRLIDDFERRGKSLTWLERTATDLAARGRSGPRSVLNEIARRRTRRVRGERVRGSWFQKLVAECTASPLIPEIVEEYEIRDADGAEIARVDLAIPSIRLAIEAHSRRWHFDDGARSEDEWREMGLATVGWDVRYVGWAATTKRPGEVREYLERIAQSRLGELAGSRAV